MSPSSGIGCESLTVMRFRPRMLTTTLPLRIAFPFLSVIVFHTTKTGNPKGVGFSVHESLP